MLRLATLERLGGASEIVRRHVDSALDALTAGGSRAARARIFQFLVTPAGTKIALGVEDLYLNAGMSAGGHASAAGEALGGRKPHSVSVAPAPDQPARERYQIFHDVLAQKVLEWRRRYIAAADQRAAETRPKNSACALKRRRRPPRGFAGCSRSRSFLALTATGLAGLAWQQMNEARAQRETANRLRIVADKGAADADLANRSAEQRRLELLASSAARGALEQENRNLQLARNAAEARLSGQAAQGGQARRAGGRRRQTRGHPTRRRSQTAGRRPARTAGRRRRAAALGGGAAAARHDCGGTDRTHRRFADSWRGDVRSRTATGAGAVARNPTPPPSA